MTGAIQGLTATYKFNLINFDFLRWHTYEQQNWVNLDGYLSALAGGISIRGIWQNSTQYAVNDRVVDNSTNPSLIYICAVANTSAASPTSFAQDRANNPSWWQQVQYSSIINTGYALTGGPINGVGTVSLDASVGPVDNSGYLQPKNATTVTFVPLVGNQLYMGGASRTIPAAGIDLPNTNLSAGALYYVYAYWTGTAIALETSNTAYIINTDSRAYKTGDLTRRLIGMVMWDGTTLYCLSYLNRRNTVVRLSVNATANTSTTAVGTFQALSWPDEAVTLSIAGTVNSGAANQVVITQLFSDNVTANVLASVSPVQQALLATSGAPAPLGLISTFTSIGGLRRYTTQGLVNVSGAGTWGAIMCMSTRG